MFALADLARAATQTFTFTGSEQTFVVPAGVTRLHVVAIGGRGGEAGSVAGGAAAKAEADFTVTPGQTLYVEVGGNGQDVIDGTAGAGGFNGGGAGGGGAGGGGGASDLRLLPRTSGLAPDTRLIVAGGGGGGAGSANEAGGAGGAAGAAGSSDQGGANAGGGAGTLVAGGSGGSGCAGSGETGQLGLGGAGDGGEVGVNGGGGGGGGYFGGGGGSGGCTYGGGGGGGGSSIVPAGGSVALAPSTAAQVQISYTQPPAISIVTPADGAVYTQAQAVAAIYSCASPDGAGITSCAGPVANGGPLDTTTLGLHTFTVEAKDSDGGFASRTVTYMVVAPPAVVPLTVAPSAPETKLGAHPAKTIKTDKKKVKVKFTFSSPTAGVSFKCKLDKGAFAPCTSPKSYKVRPGKHSFSVEAVGAGGTDPTPASFRFTVKKQA